MKPSEFTDQKNEITQAKRDAERRKIEPATGTAGKGSKSANHGPSRVPCAVPALRRWPDSRWRPDAHEPCAASVLRARGLPHQVRERSGGDELLVRRMSIIAEHCTSRTQVVNPMPPIMEPGEFFMPYPLEVEVGGATVFVMPVERFERL